MDPLHPIVPPSPDFTSIPPLPGVRRVQRDPRREDARERERRRHTGAHGAPRPGDEDDDGRPHVDLTA